MMGAILRLAARRLRGRAGQTLLVAGAVAAATALVGTIAAFGLLATDRAVAGALGSLDEIDRTIQVSTYAPTDARAGSFADAAEGALATADAFTGEAHAGVIFRRVRDGAVPYDLQLVAVDGAADTATLLEGRTPATCDGGATCEAVLLSRSPVPVDLPSTLNIGGLRVTIVGRGTLATPLPLGRPDERGPQRGDVDASNREAILSAAVLLVDGTRSAAAAGGLAATGRTYLWTAPLATDSIRPWTVEAFRAALDDGRRGLAATGLGLALAAPEATIDAELARGAAAGGRLLLVGALGVAILVAFAIYAAIVARRDLRHELERLETAGAGRGACTLLVIAESGLPALTGATLGWVAAVVIASVAAAANATDPAILVGRALVTPVAIGTVAAVGLIAAVAVAFGVVAEPSRAAMTGLVPGFVLAALVVGWRLVAGGPLGADELAGIANGPLLALIPAGVGLAVAAVAIAILPRLLRAAAARSGSAPLPLRLGLLSVARDPGRPAATLALLAFSLGGLVFAVSYAATLRQGTTDQAAFATGMDLRVSEAGTEMTASGTVQPLDRYAALGPEVATWPVVRRPGSVAPGGAVTVLGLPPDALPALRGWRSDAAPEDPAALAAAIDVPGPLTIPGHVLPAGDTTLRIDLEHSGDDLLMTALVAAGVDVGRVPFGTITPGRETVEAELPPALVGGRVVALEFAEARFIAGEQHAARLARATLTIRGLDGLIDDRPIEIETSGVDVALVRAPLPTDDMVLPALVSPDVADSAAATTDGTVRVAIGSRMNLAIRPVATAARFPTIAGLGDRFVVLDIEPLLVALGGASPGAGHPDEAWLRVDGGPDVLAGVEAALREPPFRSAAVLSRPTVEAARAADPLSGAIVGSLIAAAAAGLILAVLGLVVGAAADWRDEVGELRDLAAQGLGPRALRRQAAARTVVLAVGGVVAGVVVGLVLAVVVTGSIGLAADRGTPVPPLQLVLPWPAILALVAGCLAAAALGASLVGRRAGVVRAPRRHTAAPSSLPVAEAAE